MVIGGRKAKWSQPTYDRDFFCSVGDTTDVPNNFSFDAGDNIGDLDDDDIGEANDSSEANNNLEKEAFNDNTRSTSNDAKNRNISFDSGDYEIDEIEDMDELCVNFVTTPRRLRSQPKPLQIKPKWVETLGTINKPEHMAAPSGKKKDVHKKSREFVDVAIMRTRGANRDNSTFWRYACLLASIAVISISSTFWELEEFSLWLLLSPLNKTDKVEEHAVSVLANICGQEVNGSQFGETLDCSGGISARGQLPLIK